VPVRSAGQRGGAQLECAAVESNAPPPRVIAQGNRTGQGEVHDAEFEMVIVPVPVLLLPLIPPTTKG